MAAHNEYWTKVWENAHARLRHLFSGCRTKLHDLVDDENGIDSYSDAKKVLAFIYDRHNCATPEEMACGTLSVVEALQAVHELKEHETAPVK